MRCARRSSSWRSRARSAPGVDDCLGGADRAHASDCFARGIGNETPKPLAIVVIGRDVDTGIVAAPSPGAAARVRAQDAAPAGARRTAGVLNNALAPVHGRRFRARGGQCRAPAWRTVVTPSGRTARIGNLNGRCRMHGGMSTGPRTPEGKSKCVEAARRNLTIANAARRVALERRDAPPLPVALPPSPAASARQLTPEQQRTAPTRQGTARQSLLAGHRPSGSGTTPATGGGEPIQPERTPSCFARALRRCSSSK
jgi:hypothetical protein